MNYSESGPSPNPAEHFGEHLMLDGYGGDPTLLGDESLVISTLKNLCEFLEMTPLTSPVVISAPDNLIKDPGGWSGFLILQESHLSLHTFPKRRFLSADAYTCRNNLGEKNVADLLRDTFKLEALETSTVKRGLKYPAHDIP